MRKVRRGALGTAALVAGALALASAPASAREVTARSGPVSATVTLLPDDPVIGDPMTLAIEVRAEEGVEVLMPDFGEALDRFTIVDFLPRERVEADGRTLHAQRYTLQAPASGEHLLPSLLIEFVDHRPDHDAAPEGQDAYELLTESIAFEVRSLVPDAATADLAPPFGPLPPRGPGAGPLWPWLLAGLVIIAAAAPLAWRLHRRLRARAERRSAYELARGELDALLAGPRPTPETIDAFFVELSGIVRRYVERRFAVRSPELTTERFLELASASPDLRDEHQALLRDFLRQCDLVKFAHYIPPREAVDEAVATARRIVEETRAETATDAPTDADAQEAAA